MCIVTYHNSRQTTNANERCFFFLLKSLRRSKTGSPIFIDPDSPRRNVKTSITLTNEIGDFYFQVGARPVVRYFTPPNSSFDSIVRRNADWILDFTYELLVAPLACRTAPALRRSLDVRVAYRFLILKSRGNLIDVSWC